VTVFDLSGKETISKSETNQWHREPRDIAEKPWGAFYVETRSIKGECPFFGELGGLSLSR
jgi:hypothetical protein